MVKKTKIVLKSELIKFRIWMYKNLIVNIILNMLRRFMSGEKLCTRKGPKFENLQELGQLVCF